MKLLCYTYGSVAIFAHYQAFEAFQAYPVSIVELENFKCFVYKLISGLPEMLVLVCTVYNVDICFNF